MRLCCIALLLLAACSKETPTPTATSTTADAATPVAVFDVDAFCEKAMALPDGRKCEGDDEIIEGNKVGFCTTVLRAASDAARVSFDEGAAKRCLAAVKSAAPPLPDRRTLADIRARFEPCRSFVRGTQKKGMPCEHSVECASALTCNAATCKAQPAPATSVRLPNDTVPNDTVQNAAPKKKAGQPCKHSDECLGRCSRKQGQQCVSYCGSG